MAKLTAQDLDRLCAWVEDGRSDDWIGLKLGVSDSTVLYHRLRLGALSPRQVRMRRDRLARGQRVSDFVRGGKLCRAFTIVEDERLQELSRSGTSLLAISRALGRSPTSVRMRLLTLAAYEETAE